MSQRHLFIIRFVIVYIGSYWVDTSQTYGSNGFVADELFFVVSLYKSQNDSLYLAGVSIQSISYKFQTSFMNYSLGLKNQSQSWFTIKFSSN